MKVLDKKKRKKKRKIAEILAEILTEHGKLIWYFLLLRNSFYLNLKVSCNKNNLKIFIKVSWFFGQCFVVRMNLPHKYYLFRFI